MQNLPENKQNVNQEIPDQPQNVMLNVIDAHCHLDFPGFNPDREEAILRAMGAGVTEMVNSGVDLKTNRSTLALSRKYEMIHATLGLSPLFVCKASDEKIEEILLQIEEHSDKAAGIGEAGLDHHYHKDPAERQRQKHYFEKIIDIAAGAKKPLVIHGRDAEDECLAMSRHLDTIIFHCYGGSLSTADDIIDLGHYISIPTLVCFSKHHRQIAERIPLENMLIETDSPYLSPRKGRNEPAFILDSVSTIAKIKDMDEAEIARITRNNTRRAYSLLAH